MRRTFLVLLSTVALVGLSRPPAALAHGNELHFIAKPTSFAHTAVGEGKAVLIGLALYEMGAQAEEPGAAPANAHMRAPAGKAAGTCVTADPAGGALCTGVVELADGQIAVQGIVTKHHAKPADAHEGGGHGKVTLAIVGGSGAYAGASGEVDIEVIHAGGGHEGHPMATPTGSHESGGGHPEVKLHLAFHLL